MSTPTEIMFVARMTSSARRPDGGSPSLRGTAGSRPRIRATGQLDRCSSIDAAAVQRLPSKFDAILDVVLHLHPCAPEHAQAVEVAEQGPVRVRHRTSAAGLRRRALEQGGVRSGPSASSGSRRGHEPRRTSASSPCRRAAPRLRSTSPCVDSRWRELHHRPVEQRLGLPIGSSDRRRRRDRPSADVLPPCRASRPRSRRDRRACRAGPEIRCSSSWMISFGRTAGGPVLTEDPPSTTRQGAANLSAVAIISDGRRS